MLAQPLHAVATPLSREQERSGDRSKGMGRHGPHDSGKNIVHENRYTFDER